MTSPPPQHRPPRFLAIGVILLGLYPMAIALGWLTMDDVNAPGWLLILAGSVFVLAGLMMIVTPNDGRLDALAALLLMVFSWLGFYLAVMLAPKSIGFFGVSFGLAQLLVGVGSLITLLMSLYAWRRWNNHQSTVISNQNPEASKKY